MFSRFKKKAYTNNVRNAGIFLYLVFRHTVFDKVRRLWKVEGLNTLKYELIKKEKKKLYVWLYVNINMSIIEKVRQ